jgi:hypothetical protein
MAKSGPVNAAAVGHSSIIQTTDIAFVQPHYRRRRREGKLTVFELLYFSIFIITTSIIIIFT